MNHTRETVERFLDRYIEITLMQSGLGLYDTTPLPHYLPLLFLTILDLGYTPQGQCFRESNQMLQMLHPKPHSGGNLSEQF